MSKSYEAGHVRELVEAIDRYRAALRQIEARGMTEGFVGLADQMGAAYQDVIAAHARLGGTAPPPLEEDVK